MSTVYIRLLSHSFDYEKNQNLVTFAEVNPYLLPKIKCDDKLTLDENLNNLIQSFYKVDPKWLLKTNVGVEKLGSDYIITYDVELPLDVHLKEGVRLSQQAMASGNFVIPEQRILFG